MNATSIFNTNTWEEASSKFDAIVGTLTCLYSYVHSDIRALNLIFSDKNNVNAWISDFDLAAEDTLWLSLWV